MHFDRAGYISQLVVSGDGGFPSFETLWHLSLQHRSPTPTAPLGGYIIQISRRWPSTLQYQNLTKQNSQTKINEGADSFLISERNQLIHQFACLWVGRVIYAKHVLKKCSAFSNYYVFPEGLAEAWEPCRSKTHFKAGSRVKGTQARTRCTCIYTVEQAWRLTLWIQSLFSYFIIILYLIYTWMLIGEVLKVTGVSVTLPICRTTPNSLCSNQCVSVW